MSFTRRKLLQAGAAAAILSHTRALTGQTLPKLSSRVAPEYYVIFLLDGGFDSIYTTDPKLQRDLTKGCDAPFGPEEIVDAGVPLGPHFISLKKHMGKLAIINGVQVHTANHYTGRLQTARLKVGTSRSVPPILDLIGRTDSRAQPLATVQIGFSWKHNYSGDTLGMKERRGTEVQYAQTGTRGLLEYFDDTSKEDLQRMSQAMRYHAEHTPGGSGNADVENMERVALLFDRYSKIPPFKAEQWSTDEGQQIVAERLQRILWMFQNDVTRTVYAQMGENLWDTHYNNALDQKKANEWFFPMFARFLEELEKRSNRGGTLASRTMGLVLSELGRSPLINDVLGKDHFPEQPVVFFGPGLNTGKVFGETGKFMESMPISLTDGKRTKKNGILPQLDDVGSTLLHFAGMDPKVFGYNGRLLRFLMA